MKSTKALLLLSILGLAAVACGDDNDNNGSGSADMASYVTDCKAVCDAKNTKACLAPTTLEECKADCDDAAALTGDCAVKTKAFGDCAKKGADVCTAEAACAAEALAAFAACFPQQ